METSKVRIRREYAPLIVSVAVACDSAYSPLMQVFDAASGEYEPNRQLSPSVIRPEVHAFAADGSWPYPAANAYLTNMKWFVNGKDISTLSDWAGLYDIETAGSTRGSLTIRKNISPGLEVSLHFEAELADYRLGVTLPIHTDEVVISTIDKALDNHGISIGETLTIRYNPFIDRLLEYDYKVEHGIIAASAAAAAAAKDGNEYLRTIPIQVYKGQSRMTSGYTVKLYKIDSALRLTEVGPSDYEVISVAATELVLDLRLLDKCDYVLKAFIGSSEVATCQFSVQRLYPAFTISPTNGTGILPTQVERYDVAQAESDGKIIAYPGSVLKIIWMTDTAALTDQVHNEGGTTIFDLRQTGIGNTYADDWVDVYVEATQKEPYAVALDENGDIFIDKAGNYYIFN